MSGQKPYVILAIVVLVIMALGGYYYFSEQGASPLLTPGQESLEGRAVFSVTDVAAKMENVSEVSLTVDEVEVESAASGWITISQVPKKYNLLALHATSTLEVLADVKFDSGRYNQVRLHISEVLVTEKSGGTQKAKLPSSEMKIVGGFTVQGDKTASIVIDFLADKSLHVTGKGEYIFAPVIKFDSKTDVQAQVDTAGKVTVEGGNVDVKMSAGMDIDGNASTNFMLDSKLELVLVGNLIRVKLPGEKPDAGIKITAEKAASLAVEGGHLDVAVSVQLTTTGSKKIWRVSGLKDLLPASATVDAVTGASAMVQ